MNGFYYRFRPTSALLDKYHELENQEIYFLSPQELNDPLEGFKDLFWKGDEILWSNLLRHYLLCLMHTVIVAMLCQRDDPSQSFPTFVFSNELSLPTPSSRNLYRRICQIFLQHEDAAQIPAILASRNRSIRREELKAYLLGFHPHALNAVLTGLEEFGIETGRPPEDPLRNANTRPIPYKDMVGEFDRVQQEHADGTDLPELMCAGANLLLSQQILIAEYNRAALRSRAGSVVLAEFPSRYVGELEQLLYTDWYTACFVQRATDATMWGNYGEWS